MDKFVEKLKVYFRFNRIALCSFLVSIASLASLCYTLYSIENRTWISNSIFVLVSLLLVSLIIIEVVCFLRTKVYDKVQNKDDIELYMKNLYDKATGDIIISTTGGLNWVSPSIMDTLCKKAASNHVMIIVRKQNEKTRRLEMAGARIVDESIAKYCPLSNFSIINVGSNDARIAIGRSLKSDIHCITEHDSYSDVMTVANELAHLLKTEYES